MIDLDTLHSGFQFPVAVIQFSIAAMMFARWRMARAGMVTIDARLTFLLAMFLGIIGVKQGFWSVWGALQAVDLFHVAEPLRNHWLPVVLNICIALVGVVLLGQVAASTYGRRAYAASAVWCLALVGIGFWIVRGG